MIENIEQSVRPILEVRNLRMYYPVTSGVFKRVVGTVKAVDGVSFTVHEGTTLGLVGESGCGKTTTGRCIVRALDPSGGAIIFHDKHLGPTDLVNVGKTDLRRVHLNMQMIFQDPYNSLNPRMTLLDIVGEPLVVNGVAHGTDVQDRVALLLRRVGLRPEYMRRYPHAFSGGQRQRIGIARALALNPQFIVADEPISALDVSIQAQTLNLLQDLQEEFHLSYLLIAHDLSVVEHVADAVAVMYVGKLVETGETEELYLQPRHPYTEALLSSVPKPDPTIERQRILLSGDVPSSAHRPDGCCFHPRCRYAQGRCAQEEPALREISAGHFVSCHFAEQLQLRGVI